MLTTEQIKTYVSKRLIGTGFFEKKEPIPLRFTDIFNDKYSINIREINSDNIRCELTKSEIIGGMVFAGKVVTSCVVSDYHQDKYKKLDSWIENMLLIPDVKLRIRNNKIKKLRKNL